MFRPDPHPLDNDWRFDADTVRRISHLIPIGRVLMMGCPSLASFLGSTGREVSLVDIQPIDFIYSIKYIRADLRFDYIKFDYIQFDTIILDGPWYVDYLKAWLIQARLCSKPGSLIMFSLWPSDTRETAQAEINEIMSLANSFRPVSVTPNFLGYVTPQFKSAAAAAVGLHLGDHWRRGDLATVRVDKPLGRIGDPKPAHLRGRKLWRRYTFDALQVALKITISPLDQPPVLTSIVKDNVLADVSRRLPLRSQIDLSTSNNVVLSIENSHAFAEAFDGLATGIPARLSGKAAIALQLLYENRIVERTSIARVHSWQHFE